MANDNEKSPYVSKGFVVSVLLILVLSAYGVIVADTRASITENKKEIKEVSQGSTAVCDRVTKLEANYNFIIEGIAKLERGQEKLVETLDKHERNQATMKRWQDYPANR